MRAVLLVSGVLAVAGLAMVLASNATAVDAIGTFLMGVAAVLLVALAFYAVGASEDRDRTHRPNG